MLSLFERRVESNMNFNECMEFIGSYSRLGAKVTDLSRASELMNRIGNPENGLKFVHIAGTNGKGSTLEYIAGALEYSGYKTGKFTSPYVTHYTDRIRINEREIDEEVLGEICDFLSERVADREYSQFEISMAIAFLWFKREQCDIVVLEAGIGGLLDSTNIIPPPLLSVVTSIDYDHTAILGDTIEKIAAQKAGIIKSNSAVVLSGMQSSPEVNEIVRETAKEKGAEFVELELCKPAYAGGIYYPLIYNGVISKPSMPGIHQYENAVTALTACCYLRKKGFDILDKSIRKSIENTTVKARAQYICGNPPAIVDGAHNPEGISALSDDILRHISDGGQKIYAVMGMVNSKDYVECADIVSQYTEMIFTVDGFAANCVPADELARIIAESEYTEVKSVGALQKAVKKAEKLALKNNGIVVVCGSLYLASEYLNNYA